MPSSAKASILFVFAFILANFWVVIPSEAGPRESWVVKGNRVTAEIRDEISVFDGRKVTIGRHVSVKVDGATVITEYFLNSRGVDAEFYYRRILDVIHENLKGWLKLDMSGGISSHFLIENSTVAERNELAVAEARAEMANWEKWFYDHQDLVARAPTMEKFEQITKARDEFANRLRQCEEARKKATSDFPKPGNSQIQPLPRPLSKDHPRLQ